MLRNINQLDRNSPVFGSRDDRTKAIVVCYDDTLLYNSSKNRFTLKTANDKQHGATALPKAQLPMVENNTARRL